MEILRCVGNAYFISSCELSAVPTFIHSFPLGTARSLYGWKVSKKSLSLYPSIRVLVSCCEYCQLCKNNSKRTCLFTFQQPKYISNLLKFAETRKKEEERRVERQVQKEREAEGSEYADKDAFVTSAYPFEKILNNAWVF